MDPGISLPATMPAKDFLRGCKLRIGLLRLTMDGTMFVSSRTLYCLSGLLTDESTVHGEPGNDKIQYSNDVADWMLARTESHNGEGENKSKL